jgi:glycerol dehydrogenase-like iron-containing ADH family enzyme
MLGRLDAGSAVVTSPKAWNVAHSFLNGTGTAYLPDAIYDEGAVHRVIGIGAGAVIDKAKLLGQQLGCPVHLVPTVISTDAAFSTVAAFRTNGAVKYAETGAADTVTLDDKILSKSPWECHLRGLGDLFAIEAACRDWVCLDSANDVLRASAINIVDVAMASAVKLSVPSTEGARLIADLLLEKVSLGVTAGHPFMEEGTEHFLCYAAEQFSTKQSWHGDMLWGALRACAELQGWPDERIKEFQNFFRITNLRQEHCMGLSGEQFSALLMTLPAYCLENGYENTSTLRQRPLRVSINRAVAAGLEGW